MQSDVARQAAAPAAPPPREPVAGVAWQRRLALILKAPSAVEAAQFIDSVVAPALATVAEELTRRGRPAACSRNDEAGAVLLTAPAEGVRDFIYGVQPAAHRLPVFSAFEASTGGLRHEARTFFSDGSPGYDVIGLSREQIISDVLAQFERYLALCQSPDARLYIAAPESA